VTTSRPPSPPSSVMPRPLYPAIDQCLLVAYGPVDQTG
jgi:hypothetical protein